MDETLINMEKLKSGIENEGVVNMVNDLIMITGFIAQKVQSINSTRWSFEHKGVCLIPLNLNATATL